MAEEKPGTAAEASQADQGEEVARETAGAKAGATDRAEPESFIDPSDLPEELKPHWRRMHRAYTKKLEAVRGLQDKAGMVDRFWQDPEFAVATVQQWAQQNGFALTRREAAAAVAAAAGDGGTSAGPGGLVGLIQGELPAELKWLAQPLAAAIAKSQAPLLQQSQSREASRRSADYDELADELSETAPGWEEQEDDMIELLSFLQSADFRHKRWGSKLGLLHAMVTGNAAAISEAARRIASSARARTTTGQPGRSLATNVTDRVRDRKLTDREAWEVAKRHALEATERAGRT